ncbi:MAG: DUF1361 domain-containing protein [Tissierellaceae bacterium]
MGNTEVMEMRGNRFKTGIGIMAAMTVFYFIWIIFGGNLRQFYMIWNLILAWIPLSMVLVIDAIDKRYGERSWTRFIIIFMWILWILFYPNSPYMITDFIHISPNEYYLINPNYTPYSGQPKILFNDDIRIWIDLINIAIGVWLGYTAGFISLYKNQKRLLRRFNSLISWIFVLIVNLLTGIAVHIGRFNRWNSWDIIFNPVNIIKIFQDIGNIKALKFILLFAAFNLILYVINCVLVELIRDK